MSVLTPADVKPYLNNISGTDHDEILQDMIDAAEATIAARVGPLEPTEVISRLAGNGPILVLPVYPVISLTGIAPSDESDLDVTDLTAGSDGVVTYADGTTQFSVAAYTVTYQAGWETVPADILLAIKELVRHLFQTQRGPGRLNSPTTEPPSTGAPGAGFLLPYRVAELIAPHHSPRVA